MRRVWSLLGQLLGREPVMVVATVAALLVAVIPAFGWSTPAAGSVSAAVVAVGGLVSAWLVSVDRALPLLVGVGQAVVAAAASFGLQLTDGQISALMSVLAILGGVATRPQVGAKQPAWHRDDDGNIVYHLQPNTTYALDATLEYREAGPETEVLPVVPADAPPLPADRADWREGWTSAMRTELESSQQQREREGRHHRNDFREISGFLPALPDLGPAR